jgi:hypothetical protein
MLNFGMIATEAVISSLIYLYDGAIQDKCAIVALSLKSLSIHVSGSSESSINESALSS